MSMKGIIYGIRNKVNGKIYIGKSINFKQRKAQHKYYLCKDKISKKHCNRYLYNAVQKYGWDNFEFVILEECENLKERELAWMDKLNSCNKEHGYNLRRDTSTKCIIHEETRKLQSSNTQGSKNPNYKNKWSDIQKSKMSEIAKERHLSGKYYGEEWRDKISKASTKMWKDEVLKAKMAKKVSKSKQKYNFLQYDKDMNLIKEWISVAEIIESNPDWKWQNIYSVCNGYKPTYRGYIWRKKLKI